MTAGRRAKKAKTLDPRSGRGQASRMTDKERTQRHEMACLFPLPARRLVFWFFSSSPCRRPFFSICSGSLLCCLLESAMRWRGYDDKKQRRGNDAGSSINNVEDDSRKKGKKSKDPGFPIKNVGNDRGGRGRYAPCDGAGARDKAKTLDPRLKMSRMTGRDKDKEKDTGSSRAQG